MIAHCRSILRFISIFLLLSGFAIHKTVAAPMATAGIWQIASTQPNSQGKSYSGEVFLDWNLNGIREFSEEGIEDVNVTLELLDGEILEETQTGADGEYLFADIAGEGSFRVRIWPANGYQVTIHGDFTISTLDPQGMESRSTGLFQGVFLPLIFRS